MHHWIDSSDLWKIWKYHFQHEIEAELWNRTKTRTAAVSHCGSKKNEQINQIRIRQSLGGFHKLVILCCSCLVLLLLPFYIIRLGVCSANDHDQFWIIANWRQGVNCNFCMRMEEYVPRLKSIRFQIMMWLLILDYCQWRLRLHVQSVRGKIQQFMRCWWWILHQINYQ